MVALDSYHDYMDYTLLWWLLARTTIIFIVANGRVYGKVGLKVLTYRAVINLIKNTKVAIWNDAPLCYIHC